MVFAEYAAVPTRRVSPTPNVREWGLARLRVCIELWSSKRWKDGEEIINEPGQAPCWRVGLNQMGADVLMKICFVRKVSSERIVCLLVKR